MTKNQVFVASLDDSGISDYWRLNDELTVNQAAFLIVGIDPDSESGVKSRDWRKDERPAGYGAATQALTRNLKNGIIKGIHFQEIETDLNGNPIGEIDGSTDIYRSIVDKDSVSNWLKTKGFRTGFFFLDTVTTTPGYLEPSNPRYAPKLAAAVKAWEAVTDPKGKSPKQALDKWLREHAADFGLTDDDGNPVNQAIEDCSKIANWQPSGGAAKTPSA